MSDLKPGDHVNWNSTAGTIEGTVVKKVTSDTQIKSHHVNASEEDPQFIVKSDSTGAVAAHKPDAIHKDQKKSKSPKKAPKKTKEAKDEDEDDDEEEEEEKETKKPAKKESAGSSGSSGVSSRTRSRSGTLQAKPKKSQKEESDDDEEEEEEDEKPKKKREAPKKKASASPKKKKTKTDKESSEEEKKEDKKKASKASKTSKEEEEEKSDEKSEENSKKETSNSQEKKEESHESHGNDDKDEVVKDFQSLINMSAEEIESWLKTEDSKNTGMTREGESEAVGHQSGGKIVEMLRTKPEEWTEEQVQHARKVRSYIKRHSAQRPDKDDLEHTKWTFSLKNWGHDPMKN